MNETHGIIREKTGTKEKSNKNVKICIKGAMKLQRKWKKKKKKKKLQQTSWNSVKELMFVLFVIGIYMWFISLFISN